LLDARFRHGDDAIDDDIGLCRVETRQTSMRDRCNPSASGKLLPGMGRDSNRQPPRTGESSQSQPPEYDPDGRQLGGVAIFYALTVRR